VPASARLIPLHLDVLPSVLHTSFVWSALRRGDPSQQIPVGEGEKHERTDLGRHGLRRQRVRFVTVDGVVRDLLEAAQDEAGSRLRVARAGPAIAVRWSPSVGCRELMRSRTPLIRFVTVSRARSALDAARRSRPQNPMVAASSSSMNSISVPGGGRLAGIVVALRLGERRA
jgi:hypothetical protein